MMHWMLSILMALVILVGSGCSRGVVETSDKAAIVRDIATDDGGVRLVVRTDADELRTVDQLTVWIEVIRRSDVEAALVEPDWQGRGWTLVQSHDAPEALVENQFRTERVVTIEPFLSGEYEIPSIVVQTQTGPIATEPIVIPVVSVLEADDSGVLAASDGLRVPDELHASKWNVLVAIGVGVGVVGAGLVLWRAGRVREHTGPSPIEQLQMIAEGKCGDESEAIACVHHAIEALDEGDAELASVRTMCEHARYSASPDAQVSAEHMATQALEIVEGRR